jgi:hypothetical protein
LLSFVDFVGDTELQAVSVITPTGTIIANKHHLFIDTIPTLES